MTNQQNYAAELTVNMARLKQELEHVKSVNQRNQFTEVSRSSSKEYVARQNQPMSTYDLSLYNVLKQDDVFLE